MVGRIKDKSKSFIYKSNDYSNERLNEGRKLLGYENMDCIVYYNEDDDYLQIQPIN